MDHQAENLSDSAPARVPLEGLGDVCSHAATLAELQWRLFALDAQQAARGGQVVACAAAGALVLGIAGAVVLLWGAAEYGAAAAALPRPLALISASLLALVLSSLSGFWVLTQLRRRSAVFERSQQELQRNLVTLRRAFEQFGAQTRARSTGTPGSAPDAVRAPD